MKLLAVYLSLLCDLWKLSARSIPQGYVLDVTHECGKSVSDSPTINILSDLHIKAVAKCANGDHPFRVIDGVHRTLIGTYVASGKGCLFYNRKGDHQVELYIMWGDSRGMMMSNDQIYTIDCSFDTHGGLTMTEYIVDPGMVKPQEIFLTVSSSIPSTYITLSLQDVKNRKIVGPVPIDKTVSLLATTTGVYRNSQLRVVRCFAIGSNNHKQYAVIRAGCGDGMVFPKSTGFMTNGTGARSPYFHTFFVDGDPTISFQCMFVLCKNCNGNSCANAAPSPIITYR